MAERNQLDVYRVIAEPNRRVILDLLLEGERSVQELTPHLNISLGAISQHLQILRKSGLVTRENRGKQRIYSIRPDRLREVDEWINRYRRFWSSRLARFGEFLDGDAT